MGYDVSTGSAYAVLYCVLGFFAIIAILPANIMNNLKLGLGKNNGDIDTTTADYFLSARNSASTLSIALSFFASGMGSWVVYGTTEMGANPQLSWLGVLGYSGASAIPAIVICFLGPKIREMTTSSGEKAFSTTDFGRTRYGRVMQVAIALMSIFYMFIFLVAELTSISNVYAMLANNAEESFGLTVTISLGIVTILYTTIAGLPASILTDKFQGIIMIILVVMLTIAVTALPDNQVTKEEFELASNFTLDGLMTTVTLFIAIICAELFNQSTWQRVWAAESVPAMRKGFALGAVMVFFLMFFFGLMGMFAYAKDPEPYNSFEKFYYLAFFDILTPLANGWHIMVLILITSLAASTVDSLQNGITCILASDLVKLGWNPKWIARVFIVLVNIPAIIMASVKYDVIALFLVADLVCATSVLPVFLGLQTADHGIFKAPTELGAFLGCISGVVTVIINGIINNVEGGLFAYFWLKNGAMCSLCGPKTMVSFIVTPLISGVLTYVFSFLDIAIRGDRARKPIFTIPFDMKNSTETDEVQAVEEGVDKKDKEEPEQAIVET